MKFALALVFFSLNVSASNAPIFSLTCEGKSYDTIVKLEAKSFINYTPEEMQLRDVTATMSEDESSVVGRIDYFSTDEKYKPRVYKNHKRFTLSKLTEVERFGSYTPFGCYLQVMFPETAGNEALEFNAPTLLNCEESGELMTLKCVATKIRD